MKANSNNTYKLILDNKGRNILKQLFGCYRKFYNIIIGDIRNKKLTAY